MASYRILLVASISVLAAGAAAAQAPAKPQPLELTALDYIEIEQLTRKYAWAIDTCSNDGFDSNTQATASDPILDDRPRTSRSRRSPRSPPRRRVAPRPQAR